MEWIKVEDMPPDMDGRFVVWTNYDCKDIAYYGGGEWCFERDVFNMDSSMEVTHYLKVSPPDKDD